jgi:Ca2+/Na+ antiporter
MGAVPDGAIVLFSGLGPIAQAQSQLSIGVGTLAGSTIMLLTVSWGMCTILGRVDLVEGRDGINAKYKPRPKGSPKLTKGMGMLTTGTQAEPKVMKAGAVIMFITSLTYFVIQGPAFAMTGETSKEEAKNQHGWAIAGFVLSVLFFVGYSVYQIMAGDDQQQQKKDASLAKAALAGGITLESLLSDEVFRRGSSDIASASRDLETTLSEGRALSDRDRHNMNVFIKALFHNVRTLVKDDDFVDAQEAEIMIVSIVGKEVRKELDIGALMEKYGIADDSGAFVLDEGSFQKLFTEWFASYAASKGAAGARSGSCCGVSLGDCTRLLCSTLTCGVVRAKPATSTEAATSSSGAMALNGDGAAPVRGGGSMGRTMTTHRLADMKKGTSGLLSAAASPAGGDLVEGAMVESSYDDMDAEEEEEEEDEEEEDAGGLTRGQIFLKALTLMIVGVVVVTVFSDPMVDVLSQLGVRINIPPFYVSFIVTPLVSNASELISSLIFAMRRSKKTITLTYSQLMGAATMNNTFVLALFLALCGFRGLAWTFSAEVMAIFVVQLIMAVIAFQRIQTVGLSYIVLALYPLSIFLVFALETFANWD